MSVTHESLENSKEQTPSVSFGLKHDWTREEVLALFDKPFNDLIFDAQTIHRQAFPGNHLQLSTLMNIKTGACPEDCGYCPQSAKYNTGLKAEKLSELDAVVEQATVAKEKGATRFCMGAAWRQPKDKDLEKVGEMVKAVKDLGMESCVTLGMLKSEQAEYLKGCGLDYYNHNIDTSKEYYDKIISTRDYEDRLNTLENVRDANINVCSGGIIGLGESEVDRVDMLRTLANMEKHPESVPINQLVQVEGTPTHGKEKVDPVDFVKVIAVARIMMPASYVRLSAGRTEMTEEMQALCFMAGANSVFYGEKLLTTDNPQLDQDRAFFERLGLNIEK